MAPASSQPGTRHTIGIRHVEQTLLGARERGIDVALLLQRAGIAAALLDSPLSRVTQDQYARLLVQLTRRLHDELWGLCAQPLPLGSFAQLTRLAVGCRTLGDALALGLRQCRLQLADVVPRLRLQRGLAAVEVQLAAAPTPALVYAQRVLAFQAYGLACWLVARRVPLLAVEYPSAASPGAEVAVLFGAPVRAGCGRMAWVFDPRWLELPIVQTAASAAEFLRRLPASQVVKYRDQSSMTERIRRILRRQLGEDMPSLEEVGRQLAITPQTLRRRLAEEGLGFRAIRDDLRRDAAIEYLSMRELPLPEIAQRLGFSEASTFHRAFKHWTGVAPGEYRHTRLRGD